MSTKKLYLMPGMGLDDQIFEHVQVEGYDRIEMNWLEPDKDESLEAYVIRLIHKYNIRSKNHNVFIGHSFGGIVVQEMAKKAGAEKILIISSVKSPKEIPFKIRILKYIPAHNIITKNKIFDSLFLWGPTHGFDSKDKKELFKSKLTKLSDHYFKWAITEMIAWRNKDPLPLPIIHIHGEHDLTFPISNIKDPIIIKEGNHMMLWDQGEIINKLVRNKL